jgi:hypothetical protein
VKFCAYVKPKDALSCSQRLAAGLYTSPVESSTHSHTFFWDPLWYRRHIYVSLSPSPFRWCFEIKVSYAFCILLIHATCPACLITVELIILITYGEENELWNFSLCNIFHPSVTSSIVGTDKRPNWCSLLKTRHQISQLLLVAALHTWRMSCCRSELPAANGSSDKTAQRRDGTS